MTRSTEFVTPLTAGRKLSATTAIRTFLELAEFLLADEDFVTNGAPTDGCDQLICLDIDYSQHFIRIRSVIDVVVAHEEVRTCENKTLQKKLREGLI